MLDETLRSILESIATAESDVEATNRSLIGADYLEEQGDNRAEWIRLGAAARTGKRHGQPLSAGEHLRSSRRAIALEETCRTWWRASESTVSLQAITFRDGLPYRVRLTLDQFRRDWPSMRHGYPSLRAITIHLESPSQVEAFLSIPHLADLTGLTISLPMMEGPLAERFFSSPAISRLRELSLVDLAWHRGSDQSMLLRALVESPLRSQLERLTILQGGLDEIGLGVLLGSTWPRLSELNLSDNPLRNGFEHGQIPVAMPHLESLVLQRCGLTTRSIQRIFEQPSASLSHVNVAENRVFAEGLRAALAAQSSLKSVDLSHGGIREGTLRDCLERIAKPSSLQCLRLSGNPISDADLVALGDRHRLPELQRLDLDATRVSPWGIRQMLAREALTALEVLSVAEIPFTAEDREVLQKNFPEILRRPSWDHESQASRSPGQRGR